MTDSKPITIGELPLVTENLDNYTKYTVIGRENGQFATIAPLNELARELSINSDGIYNNGYNKRLIAESIPFSRDPYNIGANEYLLVMQQTFSSSTYNSPQSTLSNIGDVYNIKYFSRGFSLTLNFVGGKLLDNDTEYATLSLINGQQAKFMMVGFGNNNEIIFVRLHRAI